MGKECVLSLLMALTNNHGGGNGAHHHGEITMTDPKCFACFIPLTPAEQDFPLADGSGICSICRTDTDYRERWLRHHALVGFIPCDHCYAEGRDRIGHLPFRPADGGFAVLCIECHTDASLHARRDADPTDPPKGPAAAGPGGSDADVHVGRIAVMAFRPPTSTNPKGPAAAGPGGNDADDPTADELADKLDAAFSAADRALANFTGTVLA